MLSFRFMCYLLALSSGKKAKINIHLFMHVLHTWKLRWFHGKNAPGWPCYYYCYYDYDYYYGKFFFLRDKIFPILINTLNFKQSVLIFYIYHYNIHLKYKIVLRCIPRICSSVGIPQCRRSRLGFICFARVFLAVSGSVRLCPLTMWSIPHCRGLPLVFSCFARCIPCGLYFCWTLSSDHVVYSTL